MRLAQQAGELAIEISGQVNVPDDKVVAASGVKVIGCRPPGYNFPTEKVVQQTGVVANIVKDLQVGDVCLALISGGGSALLELPTIPLDDLVALSKALSHHGVEIESINAVRRCLSKVKAGGLARMKPAGLAIPMISLIISDVISDNLAMISSGPTVIDADLTPSSLLADRKVALAVLHRHLDAQQIPESAAAALQPSLAAPLHIKFQPTTDADADDEPIQNVLVGNNRTAVDAAIGTARSAGYDVLSFGRARLDPYSDVNQLGEQYAKIIVSLTETEKPSALITPMALITGGEPTVALCDSPGQGGRNLQLTAVVLDELLQSETVLKNIQFASVGTDGEDGSAPVAGGWFDQNLLARLKSDANLRQELKRAIAGNDCYEFFRSVGHCVESSADVQTNVCDLQILLIGCAPATGRQNG